MHMELLFDYVADFWKLDFHSEDISSWTCDFEVMVFTDFDYAF